jgi:alcohol dehydrogenase class IV
MTSFTKAQGLLHEFKGDTYIYGMGILPQVGPVIGKLGRRAGFIHDTFTGADPFIQKIIESMTESKIDLLGATEGARPNAPREDLFRITDKLISLNPDVIVCFGGGSTIDATKAAEVLRTLGDDIEVYFGTGLVTQALQETGKQLTPVIAIQTASSSAAHLTKYSNITDLNTSQKKLIVDDAIIPPKAIFDYEVTLEAPPSLTVDGALDGVAHSLEVLYGAIGKPNYQLIESVASESIRLVVEYLPQVIENPRDTTGREGLGLATDLGGYAIILGGTNGGHLTSFSLVDILSHGRACALMNPYYTVFFSQAIQEPLKLVGKIFKDFGYIQANIENLDGRDLGEAVANAMISFQKEVGLPTTLQEVSGFSNAHIDKALTAAKNPQLKMKLENMPVPLTADMVDEYMGSVLQAAKTGDLSAIKNVP